jgi:hypothetical protein
MSRWEGRRDGGTEGGEGRELECVIESNENKCKRRRIEVTHIFILTEPATT